MIAAERNVIQSQFARKSLHSHKILIHLFLANLHSISTQAAIICDVSFGGVGEVELPANSDIVGAFVFGYIYYFCCMCALMTALLALSHSTIYTIYGHSLFLKSETSELSVGAVDKLKSSQQESGMWGALSTLFVLMQGCVYTWANVSNVRVGIVVTLIYLIGIYTIYAQGVKTIKLFSILKAYQQQEEARMSRDNRSSLHPSSLTIINKLCSNNNQYLQHKDNIYLVTNCININEHTYIICTQF
jgi:hypothetical protein